MPWDCLSCQQTVDYDDGKCPSCGATKASWTMVPDKTRTFTLTTRDRSKCLRPRGKDTVAKAEGVYDGLETDPAEEAVSVPKADVRKLVDDDRMPPPEQILVVRLWPKPSGDLAVHLLPEFETQEMAEVAYPVERPPEGETVDVRFLLVHGSDPLEVELPDVHVIDVTEESDSGYAPRLGVRALSRRRKTLPIRPAEKVQFFFSF